MHGCRPSWSARQPIWDRSFRTCEVANRHIAVFCTSALSLPALFVAPFAARWSAHAQLVLLRWLLVLCLIAISIRLLIRL
jgi:hypothetical protein